MCGGELQLKLIEPAARTLGKQREIFVCTNCSREQTFLADRNPYVPPTACGARHNIEDLQLSDDARERRDTYANEHSRLPPGALRVAPPSSK
jgi:hypothetical protein